MWKLYRRFLDDTRGGFAIFAALSFLVLFVVIGAAIDISRLTDAKLDGQNRIDAAVLAAAVYVKEAELKPIPPKKIRNKARRVARRSLRTWIHGDGEKFSLTSLRFREGELIGNGKGSIKPILASLFGVKTLSYKVTSTVSLFGSDPTPIDIDVVLITDVTGSMGGTLSSVQANMKNFATDLTNRLATEDVVPGELRVEIIFYRDYFADSNAMQVSRFYDLPSERSAMDSFVDSESASGGGDWAESGLEAVWHAVRAPWNTDDSRQLVRAIILWTDAPAIPLGENRGAFVTPYPSRAPRSLDGLRRQFSRFHTENSSGEDGVVSMALNITTGSLASYPEWQKVSNWSGVTLNVGANAGNSSAYADMLDQVVASVLTQTEARTLAISH
ncbi:MAG: hypothetical protein COA43_07600 [Robiginitomaculum sp.]|nr:MAG: hypothetical protein COA43_07600 [Robiginitomaculum sp.]